MPKSSPAMILKNMSDSSSNVGTVEFGILERDAGSDDRLVDDLHN